MRFNVFYERQEGAWDEISRSDPNKAEEFSGGVVNIEELARTIAAADRTLSLEFAKSPNRIFDDESAYRKVFKEKNLASVRLLLFLVNVLGATRAALREMSQEVGKCQGISAPQFSFPIFRLLVHWIAKKSRESVSDFGDSKNYRRVDVQRRVRQWMTHHNSGIQQLLPEVWWDEKEEEWAEALDKERLNTAFRKLRLENTLLFEGWGEFDVASEED